MENNFDNEELKNNVLKKLEQKIAIEEFKEQEQIKNNKKELRRKGSFLKVASLLVIAFLLTGNVYTYATYEQNIFSYIFTKVGILENYAETSIEVEQEIISEDYGGNSLTLVSYGMDKETLLVNYHLKFSEEQEYFVETLFETASIVDGDKSYNLDKNNFSSFYKISDTEYEIVKSFDIDASMISDNARFVTNASLYKELDGPIADLLGNWEFDIKLEKSKLDLDYKEYDIKDKEIELFKENGERNEFEIYNQHGELTGEVEPVSVKILGLKESDLATKLIFYGNLYTNINYFVEILDENGNVLLENKTAEIYNMIPMEILFSKVSLDSKLRVNIYEYDWNESGEEILTSKGTIELDLSKDLIPKEEKEHEYNKVEWEGLSISYDENTKIEPNEYHPWINIELFDNVGDYSTYGKYISIKKSTNILNQSLDEIVDILRTNDVIKESKEIVDTYYFFVPVGNDTERIDLSYEEVLKLDENGKIEYNGKDYDKSDLGISIYPEEKDIVKETLVGGVRALTYTDAFNEDIYVFLVNDSLYVITCPTDFDYTERVDAFISGIEINN